jgi:hypothetical protein
LTLHLLPVVGLDVLQRAGRVVVDDRRTADQTLRRVLRKMAMMMMHTLLVGLGIILVMNLMMMTMPTLLSVCLSIWQSSQRLALKCLRLAKQRKRASPSFPRKRWRRRTHLTQMLQPLDQKPSQY